MIVLRELAPAKINLYLHITGKRADDYHLLDSLVVFADFNDKVEVSPASTLTLAIEGKYAKELSATDNTVLKTAEIIKKTFNVSAGAALTLHKNIPIGAGIGGGSSDAAATMRLLMRFWKINPTPKELNAIALSVGADVPACLRASSLYMSGIGEKIEPGPLPTGFSVVLAGIDKPLLTKDVFAKYNGNFSKESNHPFSFPASADFIKFLQKTKNDLQDPAIKLMPEIENILSALSAEENCLLTRMSGSGATCFGLFADKAQAEAAAIRLDEQNPTWWVKTANIR